MSATCSNPNFPVNLDIHPSEPSQDLYSNHIDKSAFGSRAQELAILQYGIAGRVWEAAYAMNLFVDPPHNIAFDPPFIDASRSNQKLTVIELGSGSGLVASSIARLLKPGHDNLIVTDLPEVCPLLAANLRKINTCTDMDPPEVPFITVESLSWGNHEDTVALASLFLNHPRSFGPLTHIVCSDLVYFPELLGPLLRSLLDLTSPPFAQPSDSQNLSIFISYKVRSLTKESAFWSALGLWFHFSPVLIKDGSVDSEWRPFGADLNDATFLFVAHRRPESYKWKIPPLDDHLLGGVGAYDSSTRKGDDTFENLLFLSLGQDR